MSEEYELYGTYLSVVDRSYRVDGGVAESGRNHDGLVARINYVEWKSDKEDYFNELRKAFLWVMTREWDEENANRFMCRMEDGEFIAERYYKQIDEITFDHTEEIEEADEIERYAVRFFFVDTEDLLEDFK